MMFNNPNSYEEVKSLISEDEYKKIYGGSDRLISEKAVLDTIADFIKNNDSVAKLILNINAIPPADKWIPISERLPEEAFGCLVTVRDTDRRTQEDFENLYPKFVGWDGKTWNDAIGEPIPFEVLAWMPLPTPYEPQESEDGKC